MALPPTLKGFREQLDSIGYAKRTVYQDSLLEELEKLDNTVLQKSIEEATFSSSTKMTSPGGDTCPCCGR